MLGYACLCYAVPYRDQLCWPFRVPLLFRKRILTAVTKSGTGTWDLGRGDSGTWGRGDAATHFRSIEFQKWDNIAKKVELLVLFCFSSTS